MDEDLVVALRLQREWDARAAQREAAREPPSLVDASWELVDPTPDLQALFVQFNDRFFWGRLEAVEVKWSVRMTLCAGICLYEGRGGMCSIRLSEPLLKLRPRKDLVETLLHEMIHAYLFVTDNDKDREGHGPEFCKHMRRINDLTGANITIYHSFHDEVEEYRRHWWRCDGPCQHRQPYHGYVKRATNRAPSRHDYWWAEHQKTCGGTFVKVREPESHARKGKRKAKAEPPPGPAVESQGDGRRAAPQLVPFSGERLRPRGDRPPPPRPLRGEAPPGAGRQSVLSSYFPPKAFRSVSVPSLASPRPSPPPGAHGARLGVPGDPQARGPSGRPQTAPAGARGGFGRPCRREGAGARAPAGPGAGSRVVSCPVCLGAVAEAQINQHLDLCLEGTAGTPGAAGSEVGRGSPRPEVL
ncbi:LOW QUALITY PROTEIN: DNA-dependent metalloprotease SPRTN [Perognathus longimembris pacificus]|uniref:LOW QUALITY PROTEIN: DNA-dependent metalloprotease SPRTN n=1 Tax=Perognathus longimembris pacificus TaxID=214514 RepID=UPI0020191E74|nr:LOW QUALITY PROTEIN: DNA-dependent metalloprotease SPRTN [Perognathus longimembris pacificus]